MEGTLKRIYESIINGEQSEAVKYVQQALAEGINPVDILNEGMVKAMAEVGRLFEEGEYFVPEMLIAARAMQSGLAIIKPQLVKANVKSNGKVVVGTVKGDLHDIGKNLVAMMLEGAGFEILDLGTDVAPEAFVAASDRVNVVALSALLTTTMPNMKATIDALKSSGKRAKVKVIIGGAPVTEVYAQQIGADGYAPDASRAVSIIKALLLK